MSENQINCILSIMKLIFNGTRGYIDKFSDKRRFHSVLTVEIEKPFTTLSRSMVRKNEYAGERNVDAAIAYDGMEYIV